MSEDDPRSMGCEHFVSITFSQEWYDTFGVVLCPSCKNDEQLITKVFYFNASKLVQTTVSLAGRFVPPSGGYLALWRSFGEQQVQELRIYALVIYVSGDAHNVMGMREWAGT